MRVSDSLVIGCLGVIAVIAPARGAMVLDQEFAPPMADSDLGGNVNEGVKRVGQTFTAGLSGPLTRVTLDFRRFERGQSDFEFTIRATSAGLPAGAPLATEVLPFTAVPFFTTLGDTSFDLFFDPAPLVEAGRTYAIVVQSPLVPPGAGQATGLWGGSSQGGYPSGTTVISDDDAFWDAQPFDLFFRTYVGVPEPAAVAPLALASALLFRRRRGGAD